MNEWIEIEKLIDGWVGRKWMGEWMVDRWVDL